MALGRAVCVVVAVLLGPFAGARADDHLDEDLQLWPEVGARFVLRAGPVELAPFLELQPRFDDDGQDLAEVQARAGLLVQPLEGLALGAGFMFSPTFEEAYRPEYRPYQEVGFGRDLLAGMHLHGRVRLEERFFEGQDPPSLRLRLRVRVRVPLTSLGGVRVGASIWEEPFFNLNDAPGQRKGFVENRAFAGLVFQVASGIELELGYMSQLSRVRGGSDDLGHTVWIALALTFQ